MRASRLLAGATHAVAQAMVDAGKRLLLVWHVWEFWEQQAKSGTNPAKKLSSTLGQKPTGIRTTGQTSKRKFVRQVGNGLREKKTRMSKRRKGTSWRKHTKTVQRRPKLRNIEKLEERHMLSIDPIQVTAGSANQQAAIDRALDMAFQVAADLDGYTSTQLEQATRWVVKTDGSINATNFAAETGLLLGGTFGAIPNTYFATAGSKTSGEIISRLGSEAGVAYFYPEVATNHELRSLTNDPLVRDQWHIRNTGQQISNPNEFDAYAVWGADARIEEAWKITTGEGVVIAVVDDGVFIRHPDLVDNIDDSLGFDYTNLDSNPSPNFYDDFHGTAVAGIIGGVGNNNLGIAGIAYDTTLAGIRLIGFDEIGGTFSDERDYLALTHLMDQIDVYNNSWGPPDISHAVQAIGPMHAQALIDSAFLGRNGLGTIHVVAAGNGAIDGSSNHDSFANSPYVIAVSGFGADDFFAPYAEGGPNVFVTAPTDGETGIGEGIVTLDLPGDAGYNAAGLQDGDNAHPDFTYNFGGTSAAAPVASGVIGLMISAARANGIELTQRDVQHILARSSRKIDPTDFGGTDTGGWQVNTRPLFANPMEADGVPVGDPWPIFPGGDNGLNLISGVPDSTDFLFALSDNGAGFYVHDGFDYGYGHGAVDAKMAVEMAQNWVSVGGQSDVDILSASFIGVPIQAAETVDVGGRTITIPGALGTADDFADYFDLWLNPPEEIPEELPVNTRGQRCADLRCAGKLLGRMGRGFVQWH